MVSLRIVKPLRVPLQGFSATGRFNLQDSQVDPTGALSLIRLPEGVDLLAAYALEQLVMAMRNREIRINDAETGHGMYSGCTAEFHDLTITLLLTQRVKSPVGGRSYELQLGAAKPSGVKLAGIVPLSNKPSVPTSDDVIAWKAFRSEVDEQLSKSLHVTEIEWTTPDK